MSNFLLDKKDIKNIYKSSGNAGCIASNRITVDGMKVGYMYREESSLNFPDSGWRFFAGDESDIYADNPKNFNIFDLNTICNYDDSVMPFLGFPIGSSFIKEDGKFKEDNY